MSFKDYFFLFLARLPKSTTVKTVHLGTIFTTAKIYFTALTVPVAAIRFIFMIPICVPTAGTVIMLWSRNLCLNALILIKLSTLNI